MKTLLATSALALTLASTSAFADEFDNTQAFVTAKVGNLEFTLEGTEDDGFAGMDMEYRFLEYGMGQYTTAEVFGFVEYEHPSDDISLGGEYKLTYQPSEFFLYGGTKLSYDTNADNFDSGDFFVKPNVGMGYHFNSTVSAWAEVGYAWNMSENFDRAGGEVEVGMDIALADNVTFKPSVVHTFDMPVDETQARFGVEFQF